GVEHLKPMTMEDVAKSIGVHTSTIHRIVKGKYAQTPFGVFPLKFFFSRGYVSQSGEEVSAKAIKEKIRELINSEDKKIPLSDEEISNLLKELGFKIARRTVAKYRESMGIPPARFRKEIV
ncbi:MAG: RNA polymerase sigma-54 factor, partial [bacterium]